MYTSASALTPNTFSVAFIHAILLSTQWTSQLLPNIQFIPYSANPVAVMAPRPHTSHVEKPDFTKTKTEPHK